MKAASILIAFVIVLGFVSLGFVSEARAEPLTHDYSITMAGQRFGFVQSPPDAGNSFPYKTHFHMGPLGSPQVPVSAIEGLVGFCVIIVGLIALVTTFTFRWKRKAANRL